MPTIPKKKPTVYYKRLGSATTNSPNVFTSGYAPALALASASGSCSQNHDQNQREKENEKEIARAQKAMLLNLGF